MSTLDDHSIASMGAYALDNASPEAATRFPALADAFDAGTQRHLTALGLGAGWHCLEVGGGGGSIARWLAERVGETGHVLVTDIDPRHLECPHHPRVEIRVHDIAADPLPPASSPARSANASLTRMPHSTRLSTTRPSARSLTGTGSKAVIVV